MNILIATGIYPPQIGGPATYSKLLHDRLPAHGHSVMIVNFGAVLHLPKIIRHVAYFFMLCFRARGADIVYAQDPVSVGLPAMLAVKILRKKFVLKVVGDYAWEQGVLRAGVTDDLSVFAGKSEGYPLLVRVLKRVQRAVARSADALITPSDYLKTVVSAWGVAPEKITVVYNAFEPSAHSETKEDARRALNITTPAVLSSGRLVPWKGFPALMRAVGAVAREFPAVTLFIAGGGPEEARLKEMAETAGLAGHVVFLGALPRARLLQFVRAADVFALNTAYEGFSHQLLEVMAEGTPVVSTAVGGNPELIADGAEGILVPFDDTLRLATAIIRVLHGGVDISAMTLRAKEKTKSFTEERMIKGLLDVLLRV